MRLLPPLIVLPLAACGTSGALHQATLAGQCAAGDEACARRHPVAPLAIGTRFYPDVSTEIPGSTTPHLVLDSAAPDIVAVDDGALVARAPGVAAVLISTDDGAVVDFVHVWVAAPDHLTLARRDGDRIGGAIGLAVGEDVTLQPILWAGAQRLAGDAEAAWTASTDGVVSVLRDGSLDRRRIRARAPGTTTLTVAHAGVEHTVAIEVVP